MRLRSFEFRVSRFEFQTRNPRPATRNRECAPLDLFEQPATRFFHNLLVQNQPDSRAEDKKIPHAFSVAANTLQLRATM
jgi:hypothetical protein